MSHPCVRKSLVVVVVVGGGHNWVKVKCVLRRTVRRSYGLLTTITDKC